MENVVDQHGSNMANHGIQLSTLKCRERSLFLTEKSKLYKA